MELIDFENELSGGIAIASFCRTSEHLMINENDRAYNGMR